MKGGIAGCSGRGIRLKDRWILGRADAAIASATEHYERFRLNDAAAAVYHFLWSDLADWYVEELFGAAPAHGAILIEAPKVTVQGILAANGLPLGMQALGYDSDVPMPTVFITAGRKASQFIAATGRTLVADFGDTAAAVELRSRACSISRRRSPRCG